MAPFSKMQMILSTMLMENNDELLTEKAPQNVYRQNPSHGETYMTLLSLSRGYKMEKENYKGLNVLLSITQRPYLY